VRSLAARCFQAGGSEAIGRVLVWIFLVLARYASRGSGRRLGAIQLLEKVLEAVRHALAHHIIVDPLKDIA